MVQQGHNIELQDAGHLPVRYRLAGLNKGPAYRLFIEPSAGLLYPKATLRAPAESPALERD